MKTLSLLTLLFMPAAWGLALPATSAPPKSQPTVIHSPIPQEVFDAAGLGKLSATEMSALNTWLKAYVSAAVQTAAGTAMEANPPLPSPPVRHDDPLDVIESQIDGPFEGWTGQTVFRLRNGQVWQQAAHAISIAHARSPAVIIFRQMSYYRMKVEGVPGTVMVRRVREGS